LLFLNKLFFKLLTYFIFIRQEIIIEKEKIDLEKKSFDENMQKDLELRKAKLVELLVRFKTK
jgi:hypothetical protein